jgi:hypothetical protein
MTKKRERHKGSIETEVYYDDQAKTTIGMESFVFQGIWVNLSHSVDDSKPCVSVSVRSKNYEELSVFVTKDSDEILFAHNRGDFSATLSEIEAALDFMRSARYIARMLR